MRLLPSFASVLVLVAGCASATPRTVSDGGNDASLARDAAVDARGLDAFVSSDTGLDAPSPAIDAAVLPDAFVDPDTGPLPYPERDPMRLKELQPDFFDMDQIAGNNTGGVAMNLLWANWEPSVHLAPCDAGQILYDGHCFDVDAAVDTAIAGWSARGLNVTAVTYGTPPCSCS